jgi:prepilin-type processing-associated H-X9-DG protein
MYYQFYNGYLGLGNNYSMFSSGAWPGLTAPYIAEHINFGTNIPLVQGGSPVLQCPTAPDPAPTTEYGTLYYGWNGQNAGSEGSGLSFMHSVNIPDTTTALPSGGSQWWASGYGFNAYLYYYPSGLPAGVMSNLLGKTNDYFNSYGAVTAPTTTPVFFDCVWIDAEVQQTQAISLNGGGSAYPPVSGTNCDWVPGNTNGLPDNPVQNAVSVSAAGGTLATSTETGATTFPGGDWMTNRITLNRHNFAINMVFADGSAQTVPLPQIWSYNWFLGYQPIPGKMPVVQSY